MDPAPGTFNNLKCLEDHGATVEVQGQMRSDELGQAVTSASELIEGGLQYGDFYSKFFNLLHWGSHELRDVAAFV
jgi:hypothetical protein